VKAKIHGTVIVLFVLAGICYAAHWMGAAIAIAFIGMLLELAAWLAWIDKKREKPRETEKVNAQE
jgi:protein-S-isoprenylcysteine O-methyltransferase Ste14